MANESILHIRGVSGGASGTTAIAQVVSAEYTANPVNRVQRSGGAVLPRGVHFVGATPQLTVITEDRSFAMTALAGLATKTVETVVVQYRDSGANRKTTYKFMVLEDVRQVQWKAVEDGQQVTRFQLVYAGVDNFDAAADTWAEHVVDATDT